MFGWVNVFGLENGHHKQQQEDGHGNQREIQHEDAGTVRVKQAGNQTVGQSDPDHARDQVKRIKDVLFFAGGEVQQKVIEHQRQHHADQQGYIIGDAHQGLSGALFIKDVERKPLVRISEAAHVDGGGFAGGQIEWVDGDAAIHQVAVCDVLKVQLFTFYQLTAALFIELD